MKCIKCGKPVSEEAMKARYEELLKLGIVPMLIPMCEECRDDS